MKVNKIYTGELNENLKDCLLDIIKEANDTNTDIFVNWNNYTFSVSPGNTVDDCMNKYEYEIKKDAYINAYENNKLISYEELGVKIANLLKKL